MRVYACTHTAEGVSSGCGGFQGQPRAGTAAAGDEGDDDGIEGAQHCLLPKALVQTGGRGTRVDEAALPVDSPCLVFLMPRAAGDWGWWLQKGRVVSRQCPGGTWDRAGLVQARCRWPVTPGWSNLRPLPQTPDLQKSLKWNQTSSKRRNAPVKPWENPCT